MATTHEGLLGLANLGNTCFLNAVVQCIAHCTPLCETLEKCTDERFYLYSQLLSVIRQLKDSSNRHGYVRPNMFVHECYRSLASSIDVGCQNDASEFLMALVDVGSKPLRAKTPKFQNASSQLDLFLERIYSCYVQHAEASSPLAIRMMFQIVSQTQCGLCKKRHHRFEHSLMMITHIQKGQTLKDAIATSFNSECVPEWECDGCKQKCPTSKTSRKLTILPDVLVVSINSFDSDMNKLSSDVMIDLEVDVTSHTMMIPRNKEKKYILRAIACHTGSNTQSGHYLTVAKDDDGVWRAYDDEVVRDVPNVYIKEKHLLIKDGYLAFYTLR